MIQCVVCVSDGRVGVALYFPFFFARDAFPGESVFKSIHLLFIKKNQETRYNGEKIYMS